MSSAKPIELQHWGLVSYREAFDRQTALVSEIAQGETSEKIIFCTHAPVVTLGRGTKPGDVFAWNGETIEVNRGGRATYHGPNQIVMYPLIYLGDPDERFVAKALRPKDLHEYMRVLEASVVDVLAALGVTAQGKALQTQVGEVTAEEATGVWVQDRKVASIGIAVRKWVTSHGVALNVWHDPLAFIGMNPCGFRTEQMTDLETLTSKRHTFAEVEALWSQSILRHLKR